MSICSLVYMTVTLDVSCAVFSEGQPCPEKYLQQSCIHFRRVWYVIGCWSENWYGAKAYCLSKGGNLAILNSDEKRFAILNVVVERKLFQQCGWLYIGLRQEDWWIQHKHGNGTFIIVAIKYSPESLRVFVCLSVFACVYFCTIT